MAPFRVLSTRAHSKAEHLNSPQLGSRLADDDRARLVPDEARVRIVVSDGLSAEAVHENAPDLLRVLFDALRAREIVFGTPLLVRYGRVKLAEEICKALDAELVIHLLGERPGGDAESARSLSAYLVYRTRANDGSLAPFEYTVVSNIRAGGLPPLEAGGVVAEKALQILGLQAAGNRLEQLLAAAKG